MPDGLELMREVVQRDIAPGKVERIDTVSIQGCKSLTLLIRVGEQECVRIAAVKNDLTEWRVRTIDASLPKLLWGHNGRCIKTEEDYLMALTVLRRLVKLNVTPQTQDRILPGMGPGNRGYIGMAEITVQMNDPGARILIASHSAKYPKIRKPSGIFYGQSTKIVAKEHGFSIYNKALKMGLCKGRSNGLPDSTTRIERFYRSSRRLARAIQGKTDPSIYIATLSFADAYALLRGEIRNLIGFHVNGPFPPAGKFNKHALIMASFADVLSPEERTLDSLMSRIKATMSFTPKTEAKIRRDLGALLAARTNITLEQLIPSDPADFPWEDLEKDFLGEMQHRSNLQEMLGEDIKVPDPAVVEAFSNTLIRRTISGENSRLGPTDGSHRQIRFWETNIR